MSWPCLIIAAGCVCLFMIDACCYDEDDECINILLLYAWSSFVHDVESHAAKTLLLFLKP
jgi:hypothetical protein